MEHSLSSFKRYGAQQQQEPAQATTRDVGCGPGSARMYQKCNNEEKGEEDSRSRNQDERWRGRESSNSLSPGIYNSSAARSRGGGNVTSSTEALYSRLSYNPQRYTTAAIARVGVMIECEDPSALIMSEYALQQELNSARAIMPSSYKGYQQTQLLPMRLATPTTSMGNSFSAATAGFSRGQYLGGGDHDSNTFKHNQHQHLHQSVPTGYFFESPSKYVSLKQYKAQNNLYLSTSNTSELVSNVRLGLHPTSLPKNILQPQHTPVFDYHSASQASNPRRDGAHSSPPRGKNVKEWFERLCLQDKSIVLTIVDKQLVNLIFQMFKVYTQEGNVRFLNHIYPEPPETHEYGRVKNYPLLYKRVTRSRSNPTASSYLKQTEEAENALITNIRLLNIMEPNDNQKKQTSTLAEQLGPNGSGKKKQKQNQKGASNIVQEEKRQDKSRQYITNFDAITLDMSFYKNTQYFFELMRYANSHHHFLSNDMLLSTDPKKLEQSVFYHDSKNNKAVQESLPQRFFTFYSIHDNTEALKKGMTLGQCLFTIFAKAVNVQYQDYVGTLDNRQHQTFFFLTQPVNTSLIFLQDQLLTLFFSRMSPEDRSQILTDQLDQVEKDLKAEESIPIKQLIVNGKSVCGADPPSKRLTMILQQDDEVEEEEEEGESADDLIYRGYGGSPFMGSKYNENAREHMFRAKGISSSRAQFFNYQHDSDDSNNMYDLESQRQTPKCGGAVGKLKALKQQQQHYSYGRQSHRGGGNLSLQDGEDDEEEEEEYEDDFEPHKESSSDRSDGALEDDDNQTYFMKFQSEKSKRNEILLQKVENPLVRHNKYFFVKKELEKYKGSHNAGAPETEQNAFSLIKWLSTYISLETVLAGSSSSSTSGANRLNFSSRTATAPQCCPSGLTNFIPIKERLYENLVKLEEKSRWDSLLESSVENTNKNGKNQQNQQAQVVQNQQKQTQQQVVINSMPKLPLDEELKPVQASTSGTNKQKNKKKKQKEKEKRKKAQAAAAAAAAEVQQQETQSQDINQDALKQIRQEQSNIQQVKDQIQKWYEQQQKQDEEESVIHLPSASQISIGLKNGMQDDLEILYLKTRSMYQKEQEAAYSQKRHIEERTSLLTGQYQKDKYQDDCYLSHQLLCDPTIMPEVNRNQTQSSQYQGTGNQQAEEDVEMRDEEATENKNEQQQKKKKRKKKNKKKKKNQDEEDPTQKENSESPPIKLDEVQLIEQAGAAVSENSSDQVIYELSLEDKAFIAETYRLGQEIRDEIELFESTQQLTEEVASSLIQSVIDSAGHEEEFQQEQKSEQSATQPPRKKSKGANKQANQSVAQTPSQSQPLKKLSRKQATRAAKKAQAELKKAAEDQQERKIRDDQEDSESKDEDKSDSKIDVLQLNNQNLQLLNQQDSQTDGEITDKKNKKVVVFNMSLIKQGVEEEELKVPKRGSSRGSSCTEEKNHQDTISMITDLFPQKIKDPSDDTKQRIKITTSSSSTSFQGSPNESDLNCQFSSPLQPYHNHHHTPQQYVPKKQSYQVSKFPTEDSQSQLQSNQLSNQNKKRTQRNHQTTEEQPISQPEEQKLRYKPKTQVKSGAQQQTSQQQQKQQQKKEFESYEAMFQSAYQTQATPITATQPEETKVPEQPVSPAPQIPEAQTEQALAEEKKPTENLQKQGQKKKQPLPPTVKEMKERGAIARPQDIEGATTNKKQQHQQHKTGKAPATTPSPTPIVGLMRSSTPTEQQIQENRLIPNSKPNSKTSGKDKGSNNTKTPQPKKKGQQQGSQQHPNQTNRQQQLQSPPSQYNQIQPNSLDQNQYHSQQYQFGMMMGPNFFLPQQQPQQQYFMPTQAVSSTTNNPYFSSLPDLSNYNTTSFQTPPSTQSTEDTSSDQQKNSQQTQTDETRMNKQQQQQQQHQNAPVVMNQYQNINVQVHMGGSQQTGMNAGQAYPSHGSFFPGGPMMFDSYAHSAAQQQMQFMMPQSFLNGPQLNPAFMQSFLQGSFHQDQTQSFQMLPNQFQSAGVPFFNPMQASLNSFFFNQMNSFFPQNQGMVPIGGGASGGSALNQSFQNQVNPLMQSVPQQMYSNHFPPQISNSRPNEGRYQRIKPSINMGENNNHHSMGNLHYTQQSYQQNQVVENIISQLRASSMAGNTGPHNSTGVIDFNNLQNEYSMNHLPQESVVSHMNQDQYQQKAQQLEREELFHTNLDNEIYRLQERQRIKLASIEKERQETLRCIEQQVKKTFSSNARIQMYGSMATGLAIDSSDMDLLISGIFNSKEENIHHPYYFPKFVERNEMLEQMRNLFKDLQECSLDMLNLIIEKVTIIETASVPVIKLIIDLQKLRDNQAYGENKIEEDMRFLKIDITFNDQQNDSIISDAFGFIQPLHMGIKCCNFIREKLTICSILQPITLVLKKFLALKNLNSPFLGGLNSYGLIILILSFINGEYRENYNTEGTQLQVSRTLKCFLYYFGKLFDPAHYMISDQQYIVLNPQQNYNLYQQMNNSTQGGTLIIQDPLNPQNNIGKSTFNFDQIRREFAAAFDSLEQALQEQQIGATDGKEAEENETGDKFDILSRILRQRSEKSFEHIQE